MSKKVLTVKEIPVTFGADHPEAPNLVLPKHEFSMGLIGYLTNPSSKRFRKNNSTN
jgi:hypothetical protein